MPAYRKITIAEFNSFRDAFEEKHDWGMVIEFAQAVFGDSVEKIELEWNGEYDDEGGTDWNIRSITAQDAAGNELEYLTDTEWWAKAVEDCYEPDDPDSVICEKLYDVNLYSHDLDMFFVSKPPAGAPELYIEEVQAPE